MMSRADPSGLIERLDGFQQARVLILGDVMLDRFVYGSVERISPEAPIPVLNVKRISDMPGGAANVARNVAALGAQAVLIGVVGADAAAENLRVQLAGASSIDAHLIVDATRPTTVKTRYVADGQQIMRADVESSHALTDHIAQVLLQTLSEALTRTDIVIISDYAKGVVSEAVARSCIRMARRAGRTIIVDPKAKDLSKYDGATVLTPNRFELQAASEMECASNEQVESAARSVLRRMACEVMVVTRGKHGMSVVHGSGRAAHLPTAAKQVYDVSGAGDTVIATIALALAAGAEIADAAALANAAAGIVVGKRGTATASTCELVAALRPIDALTEPQKIFSLESVLRLVHRWRGEELKIAFANGCFDLLHPGHVSLLEQARFCADRLIVGLNSDSSIRRLKGPSRPIQSEIARATMLAALKSVDAVVIFAEDTPMALIKLLQPDVLVKGADYSLNTVIGADEVLALGGRVVLAELLAGHSTTEMVMRAAATASV